MRILKGFLENLEDYTFIDIFDKKCWLAAFFPLWNEQHEREKMCKLTFQSVERNFFKLITKTEMSFVKENETFCSSAKRVENRNRQSLMTVL